MNKPIPKFTVCALLYGDYTHLAKRCLEPLVSLAQEGLVDLRVGMNDVSASTEALVKSWDTIKVFESKPQILKYPMMRRMFNEEPISTDYIMWFDDDSYIKPSEIYTSWLNKVENAVSDCDMLGSVYVIPHRDSQKEWCKTQPWYCGKPLANKPRFATGGWWCIRTDVIKKFNWPIPELRHCGGDVALGVLLDQNDLRLKHYKKGVAINANSEGRESSAERRGASRTEKPIGEGFTAGSR